MDSARKEELDDIIDRLKYARQSVRFIEDGRINEEEISRLAAHLSEATLHASAIAPEHRILTSLYFDTVQTRYNKIEPAHQNTFNWIFEPLSRTSTENSIHIQFVNWLKSGSGIYWISG